jgi:hypothetical protein
MATSPNYGWLEPDNTDLVKNGALAIRTLGNAIDTTMATMTPKSTYTAKGSIAAATAASTPANVSVGANDTLLVADSTVSAGVAWKSSGTLYPWTSFTPSWTNITLGNATNTGRYCQIGKNVFVKIAFKFGSTTSFSGAISFTHPVSAAATGQGFQSGIQILDAGTNYYVGYANVTSAGTEIQIANVAGVYPVFAQVNATTPMTWAVNDEMVFSYWYEAA